MAPAGIEPPAAGEVNWTSAKTKEGARAARRDRRVRRMVAARGGGWGGQCEDVVENTVGGGVDLLRKGVGWCRGGGS